MPLLLSEADVKSLLTMPIAIDAVENSFRRLGDGSALVHSRQRLHLPSKSYLHYMAAADGVSGYTVSYTHLNRRGHGWRRAAHDWREPPSRDGDRGDGPRRRTDRAASGLSLIHI